MIALLLSFAPVLPAVQRAPVEIRHTPLAAAVREARLALKPGRPALRGYRAPILGQQDARLSTDPPFATPATATATSDPRARAYDLVCRGLARDGLLATLAGVIETLGPEDFVDGAHLERLAEVGLPTDWIQFFSAPASDGSASAPVAWIARELAAGRQASELAPDLARCTFAFAPSRAGFRIATESGETAIGALRLQLTGSDYYAAVGDGGSLDLARQMLELAPAADVFASIEEKHLDGFSSKQRTWTQDRPGRFVVLVEALPVSQWAQDNGKAGRAPRDPMAPDAPVEVVTLVPRYASRGEDGASFMPGETFALEAFAAAGNAVVQSPLLFQGGNLLAVADPESGTRTLLVGEAEIERNRSLGLSEEQVIEALRLELGVDRCLVLPAISFHLDFEVTVRALHGELVGFVNDTPAAVATLLECGLDPLVAHQALTPALATRAREHLSRAQTNEFLTIVGPSVMRQAIATGHFPEALARPFARGPSDSGVGNLQRFLLALDLLTSTVPGLDLGQLEPHPAAYMRSFLRREAERKELARALASAGIRVVRIPSLSEDERGINYLNGIQEPDRYLMPAYGGLYAALDAKARQAFERALGPDVKVVPVLCGETQRRGGGVHCAVSVAPRM